MADSLIDQAVAAGIDPGLAQYVPRIVQLESGGNPNAVTGSYTGVLQMGPDERKQYGGDSLASGLRMYRDRAVQFQNQFGRVPTPTEFYLTNQQGLGGLGAHLANPDAPAWQNMASTAEGRAKGAGWAKQAIWGNVPTDVRAQFPGGVDSVTSQQFMDLWRRKLGDAPAAAAGASSGTGAGVAAPAPAATPAASGAAPLGMLSGADLSGQQAQQSPGSNLGLLSQQWLQMMQPKMPAPPQINYAVPAALRARLQQAALGQN